MRRTVALSTLRLIARAALPAGAVADGGARAERFAAALFGRGWPS